MSDAIQFSVDEGLARLTLNRPTRLNAFGSELAHAWRDATAETTSRGDVRAIILDATGPAFCAGGDVIEMASTMGDGSPDWNAYYTGYPTQQTPVQSYYPAHETTPSFPTVPSDGHA
ncbi:enoyl-CoA hydratase/isomerase family protein, partial [Microbacterium tenebrionis]|uniref:enoyl-CoA hydratase/isomerase family protein n=1 Tax=Microbacterium tenebrionis TaxID=2830665 RepID=UPI00158E7B7F